MIIVLVSALACCPAESWRALDEATAAELRTLDAFGPVDVVEVAGRGGGEPTRRLELASIAGRKRAAAALRLTLREGLDGSTEVDVWLLDRLTNKLLLRTLTVERKDPDSALLLALRVVELLRASFLEARLPDAPDGQEPPIEVAVPRPPELPPSSEPSEGAMRLDLGVLGTPSGTGAHAQVLLAGRWQPLTNFAAELDLAITVFGEDVVHAGAAASFNLFSARLWAIWEILSSGRVRPALGLGGGVVVCWTRGLGAPAYDSSAGTATTAMLAGMAQLGVVLTPQLWLRLTFRAGATLAETVIRFADEHAASFGRPYLDGTIGLELRLGPTR